MRREGLAKTGSGQGRLADTLGVLVGHEGSAVRGPRLHVFDVFFPLPSLSGVLVCRFSCFRSFSLPALLGGGPFGRSRRLLVCSFVGVPFLRLFLRSRVFVVSSAAWGGGFCCLGYTFPKVECSWLQWTCFGMMPVRNAEMTW